MAFGERKPNISIVQMLTEIIEKSEGEGFVDDEWFHGYNTQETQKTKSAERPVTDASSQDH